MTTVTIDQLKTMARACECLDPQDFLRVVEAAVAAFGAAGDETPAGALPVPTTASDPRPAQADAADEPRPDQDPIKKPAARTKARTIQNQSPSAAFTDADVDLIAARWAEGLTINDIADELGRGFRSIENKITRQRHKSDPGSRRASARCASHATRPSSNLLRPPRLTSPPSRPSRSWHQPTPPAAVHRPPPIRPSPGSKRSWAR